MHCFWESLYLPEHLLYSSGMMLMIRYIEMNKFSGIKNDYLLVTEEKKNKSIHFYTSNFSNFTILINRFRLFLVKIWFCQTATFWLTTVNFLKLYWTTPVIFFFFSWYFEEQTVLTRILMHLQYSFALKIKQRLFVTTVKVFWVSCIDNPQCSAVFSFLIAFFEQYHFQKEQTQTLFIQL